MIIGNLKNTNTYKNIDIKLKECFDFILNNDIKLKECFDFILNNDIKSLDCGKHIINGDKLYANVEEYQTKSTGLMEAHKKYIDIQIILSGEEKINWTEIENCANSNGYNTEKDIEFFNNTDNIKSVILKENDFVVFYPKDAHSPQLQVTSSRKVKKIVFKILI